MKLGKKAREEIEGAVFREAEGFDQDGFPVITAWLFYNALTSHITHNAVSLHHQVEMQGRLRAAVVHLMR